MTVKNFFIGIWLFVFGTMILTHSMYPAPIEMVIRASSLLDKIVDISFLRPHTDCILLALGIGYIIASVELMHGTICGQVLAILLSLVTSATFDNPLFVSTKGMAKYTMVVSHFLIISSVLSYSPAHEKPCPGLVHKGKKKEEVKKVIEVVKEKEEKPKKKSKHKKNK